MTNHSVTKFSVISSVQYNLAFITSFFLKECFPKVGIFMRIIWYYQIRPKVVWKVHGAWIDDYDSQNNDKNITITKNKSVSKQKPCDYPPCYCCHLERHLKYFTTLKNNNNMTVKFSKYNRKPSEIVTNCKFDFRLNFVLNGGHLGRHLHFFNLVNQTCECFILIVCIIRPLNIDKKSKLICFKSSF